MLITAELRMPAPYVFRPAGRPRIASIARSLLPGGPTTAAPCLAAIIRHPEAGAILIDTGMHADARTDLRKDFGWPMSLLFGSMTTTEPFDEQLEQHRVDPATVPRVLMTHLHVDHTSGMRLLPQARFICTRAEWAAAHRRGAGAQGYVAHHIPPIARIGLVDFTQHGVPFGPFTRTIDLLGDGTIRLISTPGHTRGHMSVLIHRDRQPDVLLAGDAVYTLRNLREEIPSLLTADDRAYMRSLRELKAFATAHPDAIIVPSHDPDAHRPLTASRG